MCELHTHAVATKPATPSDGTSPPPPNVQVPPTYVPGELTNQFLAAARDPSEPAPPRFDYSAEFRHGHWKPFRARVEQALRATPGITPRRVAAFCSCGGDAYVESRTRVVAATPGHAATGLGAPMHGFGKEYRIRQSKCHDRFCVPCSQERSNRIRHSLLDHMKTLTDLKLITLTQKNHATTLTAALDKITRCFRLLRNKPLWKKKILGGVWIIETKIGENSGEWHCHIHCIAQGKYINAFELSALWLAITGDSKIVKVDAVGAKTGAVSYITKYITKAADHSIVMDPVRLREAILAFTGRRLVSTFGAWRGLELMEKPDEESDFILDPESGHAYDRPQWRGVGSLNAILCKAAAGDAAARFIVSKLKRTGRPAPPVPL